MPEGIFFRSSGTLLGTYNQMTSINYILQRFEHDYERTRTFPINVKMFFNLNRF